MRLPVFIPSPQWSGEINITGRPPIYMASPHIPFLMGPLSAEPVSFFSPASLSMFYPFVISKICREKNGGSEPERNRGTAVLSPGPNPVRTGTQALLVFCSFLPGYWVRGAFFEWEEGLSLRPRIV